MGRSSARLCSRPPRLSADLPEGLGASPHSNGKESRLPGIQGELLARWPSQPPNADPWISTSLRCCRKSRRVKCEACEQEWLRGEAKATTSEGRPFEILARRWRQHNEPRENPASQPETTVNTRNCSEQEHAGQNRFSIETAGVIIRDMCQFRLLIRRFRFDSLATHIPRLPVRDQMRSAERLRGVASQRIANVGEARSLDTSLRKLNARPGYSPLKASRPPGEPHRGPGQVGEVDHGGN